MSSWSRAFRSYDFDEDKDIALFVKAGKPGTYKDGKIAPNGLETPPPMGGTNFLKDD